MVPAASTGPPPHLTDTSAIKATPAATTECRERSCDQLAGFLPWLSTAVISETEGRLASNDKNLLLNVNMGKWLGFGDVFAKEHVCASRTLLKAHGTTGRVSSHGNGLLLTFEFGSRSDETSGGRGRVPQTPSASRQNNEAGVKLRAPASTCTRRANAWAGKGVSQWRQTPWGFRSRSSPVSRMRRRPVSNDKKPLLNRVATETLGLGDVTHET